MRAVWSCLVVLVVSWSADAVAQSPSGAAPTPLAALLVELDAANPALTSARRDVDAAVARIAPSGAPPDPTVSAGYVSGFLRPPFYPSATEPGGKWQFGVTQMFPYPGKLAASRSVAALDAERDRWTVEIARLDFVAALKSAYADLWLADRSLEILEGTRGVLDQAREHAETRFRVGRGPQQDVLRAQLETSALLERLTMVRGQRRLALAAVNGVLGRRPETPLTPAALSVDAVPPMRELVRLADSRNPRVRRDEEAIRSGEAALGLARKQVLPDFGVRVMTERPVGMPWMYGVDVMASVPVFWQRKQRPLVAEATAQLASARASREASRVDAEAALAAASADAVTAQGLTTLYTDSILPQARLALEASLASYQTGSVDFLTLLANITSVLNYDLALQQQRAAYTRALARIEPLTGLTLIR